MTTTDGAGDEGIFDTFVGGGGGGGLGVGSVGRGVRSNSVLRGLAEEGGVSPLALFRRNQSITILALPVDADDSDPATDVDSDPATDVELGNPALVGAEGFQAVPETNGVARALGTFPVDFELDPFVAFEPTASTRAVLSPPPPESRSKIGVGGATSWGIFEVVFLLKGWRDMAFCRRLFLRSFVTSSSALAASADPFPTFDPTSVPFSFSFVGVSSSLALSCGNERLEVDVGRGGGGGVEVEPPRMFRRENRSVDNPFLCLAAAARESLFEEEETAEEGVGEVGRGGVADSIAGRGTGFLAEVCRLVTTAWGVVGSRAVAVRGGVVGATIDSGMGGVCRAIGESMMTGSESIVEAEIAATVSGMTIDTTPISRSVSCNEPKRRNRPTIFLTDIHQNRRLDPTFRSSRSRPLRWHTGMIPIILNLNSNSIRSLSLFLPLLRRSHFIPSFRLSLRVSIGSRHNTWKRRDGR